MECLVADTAPINPTVVMCSATIVFEVHCWRMDPFHAKSAEQQ